MAHGALVFEPLGSNREGQAVRRAASDLTVNVSTDNDASKTDRGCLAGRAP